MRERGRKLITVGFNNIESELSWEVSGRECHFRRIEDGFRHFGFISEERQIRQVKLSLTRWQTGSKIRSAEFVGVVGVV